MQEFHMEIDFVFLFFFLLKSQQIDIECSIIIIPYFVFDLYKKGMKLQMHVSHDPILLFYLRLPTLYC